MLKLNKNKYPEQVVSIADFILLISGHGLYEDLAQTGDLGHLSSHIQGVLTEPQSKQYDEVFKQLGNELKTFEQRRISGFPEIQETETIRDIYVEKIHRYYVADLLGWCNERWCDFINLGLPIWVYNQLKTKKILPAVNDGSYKISELPPLLQLAINTHLKVNWTSEPQNNEIKKVYAEEAAKLKLEGTPKVTSDTYGRTNLVYPVRSDNSAGLSQKLENSILKMVKPST